MIDREFSAIEGRSAPIDGAVRPLAAGTIVIRSRDGIIRRVVVDLRPCSTCTGTFHEFWIVASGACAGIGWIVGEDCVLHALIAAERWRWCFWVRGHGRGDCVGWQCFGLCYWRDCSSTYTRSGDSLASICYLVKIVQGQQILHMMEQDGFHLQSVPQFELDMLW